MDGWLQGQFGYSTPNGEGIARGEFVRGKWGICKNDSDDTDRHFWVLTHLPTGTRIIATTEKDDAKLAAMLCDDIADFSQIASTDEAKPYAAAVKAAFERAGLHHHGGSRYERWSVMDSRGEFDGCEKGHRQPAVMVEYFDRDDDDGFWIDVDVNRLPYRKIGPFASIVERDRVRNDLLDMMRSIGGQDVSPRTQ